MLYVRKYGFFLLLLFIGLSVRVVFLSFHGLSNDELSAWYRTGFSTWDDFWYFGVTHGDMHPVFYQLLLWIWVRIAGNEDWIIRLPSLFFYVGNMCLIYSIAKKYFSEKAAYLPLIFYIGSSFLIINTTFARPYNSGSFFLLFSFLAILKLNEKNSRSWKWIVLLSIGLLGAMLSHYFAFLTAGILGFLGLLFMNSKRRWDIVLSGVLTTLFFLPHLTVTLHQLNRGGLQWLAAPSWNWLASVGVQLTNNSVWLAFSLLVLIIFAFSIQKKYGFQSFAVKLSWLIVAVTILLGYVISYLLTPVLRELVVLFLLPFFFLSIGHAIQLSKLLTLFSSLLLLLHSFVADSVLEFHHFGDFKYVAADIDNLHSQKGYDSLTHAVNTNNVAYLNYYLKRDINEKIKNWDQPEAVSKLYMRAQMANTPYFLYILNNAYHTVQFLAVIRSQFPHVLIDKSFGDSRYVLLSKKNKQFERTNNQQLDESQDEFLAEKSWSVGALKAENEVFITNRSSVKGMGSVFGVVTIERDGKQLMSGASPALYLTFDINLPFKGNKDKGTVYLAFQLPRTCLPTDRVKCYLWNPNKLSINSGIWLIEKGSSLNGSKNPR